MIGAAALARSGAPVAAEAEPIKIVIAFPPGGTSTASLQPLRAPLAASLGAPIEFDYRPGLGGNVAALHVIQAKPDGRTLLFGHAGPLAINHHILVQSVFDAQRDLIPLAMVVQYPIVICAAAKLNVSTLKDLIDLARREQLVAGSSGNGSIQHLALETFSRTTGAKILHIPFAGGGPLQEAFERGALGVLLETGSNIVKHVQAGTLRPLAVMARERLSNASGGADARGSGSRWARGVGVVRSACAGTHAGRYVGAHHRGGAGGVGAAGRARRIGGDRRPGDANGGRRVQAFHRR
jgi:tripartite-type tricarboxylate transporter receptor subunit TctC